MWILHVKSLLTKYQKGLLEASYGTRQTSKLVFLQRKLTAYSGKQFLQKVPS